MRHKIKKVPSRFHADKCIQLIDSANVYDVAIKTPTTFANNLSAKLENDIFLKREDLQPIFSFKNRGAYNKISNLTPSQKKRGVIAASAGNHAQGVANAAKRLRISCEIVMPATAPELKIKAVKKFGAKVVLHGNNFNEALKKAKAIAISKNKEFIDAFDDPYTIAGQGTIGKEILEDKETYDAIFVPVGGGGVLAGIAAYVSAYSPTIKIYGVEVDDSACLTEAIKFGKRVRLRQVGSFADGVAVEQVGKNTFEIIKETVDGVITVTNDELCAAVKDIFEDTRVISEPAGALALAGLKQYAAKIQGKKLLAISSGANVNFERLSYIVERSEVGENREKLLSIRIPEKPGSFKKLCSMFGKSLITEFNYRISDANDAYVLVGIRLDSEGRFKEICSKLKEKKYKFQDLTSNKISRDHLRHMVGGRSPKADSDLAERIFRCEFPVRPEALLNFLRAFGNDWNISLFHYRNLGAAFANVLIGIQDQKSSKASLDKHLKDLDYEFFEETANPAYKTFLL